MNPSAHTGSPASRQTILQRSTTVRFLRWLFRWHTIRVFLFVLVTLVTLVVLAIAIENWRGKRAWDQLRREFAEKGVPLDLQTVVPPRVPDDQNFATTPLLASLFDYSDDRTKAENRWQQQEAKARADAIRPDSGYTGKVPVPSSGNFAIGERIDLAAWQDYYRSVTNFPVAPSPQEAPVDVLLALSRFDAEMAEIESASLRPYCRLPIRYEDGISALLPHLQIFRGLARIFALRATAELALGRTDRAARDVETCLRLSQSLRDEPLLISQLVHIAILQVALQPIWEGLIDHRWSEEQLRRLETELSKADFIAAHVRALSGECVVFGAAMEVMIRKQEMQTLLYVGEPGWLQKLVYRFLFPRGWMHQNICTYTRYMDTQLHASVDTERRRFHPGIAQREIQLKLRERTTPYNMIARIVTPALGRAGMQFARAESCVAQARLACALERYRLAQGHFPDSLDALVSGFVAKLPHDVITGQPLRYRLDGSGQFTLYSVGWNETDEGGSVVMQKPPGKGPEHGKGDWIWRSAPSENDK